MLQSEGLHNKMAMSEVRKHHGMCHLSYGICDCLPSDLHRYQAGSWGCQANFRREVSIPEEPYGWRCRHPADGPLPIKFLKCLNQLLIMARIKAKAGKSRSLLLKKGFPHPEQPLSQVQYVKLGPALMFFFFFYVTSPACQHHSDCFRLVRGQGFAFACEHLKQE